MGIRVRGFSQTGPQWAGCDPRTDPFHAWGGTSESDGAPASCTQMGPKCVLICPDSFPMVALEKMQVFSSPGLNGTDR